MLKKRILASSMASVMALSSASVVAFADEDTDKKYGEAVNAKELQAYIDSFDKFIADELPNYGSKQGEKFQAALDHAKAVLGDEERTDVAINAAYQMVKAVENELRTYSQSELQALIKENQAKYDKNNLLNEEIQDLIYTEDSFADFTAAFDDATNYVDSGDSRLITDAYVGLSDAVDGLSELKKVSKAQFRTALKEYEGLELKMKTYESWRRGTLGIAPATGTSKNKSKLKSAKMSMEQLIALVYGLDKEGNNNNLSSITYWDKTKWSTKSATEVNEEDEDEHEGQGRFIGGFEVGTTDSLKEYINTKYDMLDNIKGATVTTSKEIYAAYEAALDAVEVFNSWEPDDYKSGSKSSCSTLEKKYHSQLVLTFNMEDVETLIDKVQGWTNAQYSGDTDEDTMNEQAIKVTLDIDKHTLKSSKSFAIIKEKATGKIKDISDIYVNRTEAHKEVETYSDEDKELYVEQGISAGTNILPYLTYEIDATIGALQTKYKDAEGSVGHLDDEKKVTDFAEFKVAVVNAAKPEFETKGDVYLGVSDGSLDYKFHKIKADGTKDNGTKQIVDAHNALIGELKTKYNAVVSAKEKVCKFDDTDKTKVVSGKLYDYADALDKLQQAVKAAKTDGTYAKGTATTSDDPNAIIFTVDASDYTTVADNNDGTAVAKITFGSGATARDISLSADVDINSYKAADLTKTPGDLASVNEKVQDVKDAYDALVTAMKAYIVDTPATLTTAKVDSAVTKFKDAASAAKNDERLIDDDKAVDKEFGDAKEVKDTNIQLDDIDYVVTKKDITGLTADETYFTIKVKPGVTGDDRTAAQETVDEHNNKVKRIKARYKYLENIVKNQNEANIKALDSLNTAMGFYDQYYGFDFKEEDAKESALLIMEELADGKTVPSCKGSNTEWTLIWRKLAYALEDAFPEANPTKYTLKDLEDWIERAYVATEDTGDSELFSTIHQPVVDARQAALEWLKEAKATTGYKTDDMVAGSTLEDEIKDLKDPVETLEDWLKDFAYSYDEIRNKIGEISKAADDGTIAMTADLKKALNDCAYDLSVLEATDVFEESDAANPAFDDERVFQYANRLKTDDNETKFEPNGFEKNLKKSYEALVKAYEAATTPAKPEVPGDVDGDGAITVLDIAAVVSASRASSADLKYDLNGDGQVNAMDVAKAVDLYYASLKA